MSTANHEFGAGLMLGLGAGVLAMLVTFWAVTPAPTHRPDQTIHLSPRFWACTSSHDWVHAARPGMLTRGGRLSDSPAYSTRECDQWSSTWSPSNLPGCPARNVWCQDQRRQPAAREGE